MESGQAIDFIDTNIGFNSIFRDTTNGGLVINTGGNPALAILDNTNATFSNNLIVSGDLTVNGTTTTVNTDHFNVEDPLISMAKDNAANTVDIGTYGRYNDGTQRYLGLFSDASDSNTWKLFKGLTVEPTTTVDTTATGYALADLDISGLLATSNVELKSDAGNATKHLRIWNEGTAANDDAVLSWTAQSSRNYSMGIHRDSGNLVISNADASVASGDLINIDNSGNATFEGDVSLGDAKKLTFGAATDFEIYHNNTTNVNHISSLLDRQLSINGNIIKLTNQANSTTYLELDSSGNATFAGDVSLADSKYAVWGDGSDFKIHHNGTDTYLQNYTGDLNIVNELDDKDIYFRSDDGSGGTTAYFYLDGSEVLTRFAKDIRFEDSVKANFGASSDLQIYHDGSNSYIQDTGTGSLYITGSNLLFQSSTNKNAIICNDSDSVELYYNASKKFETTSAGATFTGDVEVGGAASITPNTNFSNLVITDSAHSGVSILSGNTSDGAIYFGDTDANNLGQIKYLHASNSMTFATNDTLALTLDSSQDATFAGNVLLDGTNQIHFVAQGGESNTEAMRITRSSDKMYFTFGTNAGDEAFYINSTGQTTFDADILMGNTVVNPASGFSDQTGIGLKYSGTVPELQVSSDSTAMQLGRTSTGGDGEIMAMRKAGTTVHSFDTNNVNLGTGVTINQLDGATVLQLINKDTTLVDAGDIQNQIRFRGLYYSASGSLLVESQIASGHEAADGNGNSFLSFSTQSGGGAPAERMRIDSSGNVGIKTASPSHELHVVGDELIFGHLFLQSSANGLEQ